VLRSAGNHLLLVALAGLFVVHGPMGVTSTPLFCLTIAVAFAAGLVARPPADADDSTILRVVTAVVFVCFVLLSLEALVWFFASSAWMMA
jgi:hypothetical protein